MTQQAKHQLMILRHGKASWDLQSPTDFNRPLTSRGVRDTQLVGKWIQDNNEKPDYIWCSTALRAKSTAQVLCNEIGFSESDVLWDQRMYLGSLDTLLSLLEETPEEGKRVLLVGHNPGLEQLIFYLNHDEVKIPEDGKVLTTAAIASLNISTSWEALERGTGSLNYLNRPSELESNSPDPTIYSQSD